MPGTNLTAVEAAAGHPVSVTERHVTLDLTTSDSTFATTSRIAFTCAHPGASTWIDFVGASIEKVTLNGVDLPAAYEDGR